MLVCAGVCVCEGVRRGSGYYAPPWPPGHVSKTDSQIVLTASVMMQGMDAAQLPSCPPTAFTMATPSRPPPPMTPNLLNTPHAWQVEVSMTEDDEPEIELSGEREGAPLDVSGVPVIVTVSQARARAHAHVSMHMLLLAVLLPS